MPSTLVLLRMSHLLSVQSQGTSPSPSLFHGVLQDFYKLLNSDNFFQIFLLRLLYGGPEALPEQVIFCCIHRSVSPCNKTCLCSFLASICWYTDSSEFLPKSYLPCLPFPYLGHKHSACDYIL